MDFLCVLLKGVHSTDAEAYVYSYYNCLSRVANWKIFLQGNVVLFEFLWKLRPTWCCTWPHFLASVIMKFIVVLLVVTTYTLIKLLIFQAVTQSFLFKSLSWRFFEKNCSKWTLGPQFTIYECTMCIVCDRTYYSMECLEHCT